MSVLHFGQSKLITAHIVALVKQSNTNADRLTLTKAHQCLYEVFFFHSFDLLIGMWYEVNCILDLKFTFLLFKPVFLTTDGSTHFSPLF